MVFHMTEGVTWQYGPHYLPDGANKWSLTPAELTRLYECFGIIAFVRHYDKPGIWAGPTCTRQCRHALARTRSTPSDRHTPSDRQVPFGRRGTSRLTRYTLSDRRGLSRQETYFHGGCSGEAPGALAGRLLMVGGTCVVYYPRSPDHQQPSRNCARTLRPFSRIRKGHLRKRPRGQTPKSQNRYLSK